MIPSGAAHFEHPDCNHQNNATTNNKPGRLFILLMFNSITRQRLPLLAAATEDFGGLAGRGFHEARVLEGASISQSCSLTLGRTKVEPSGDVNHRCSSLINIPYRTHKQLLWL